MLNIPIFNVELDDTCGIEKISLVESPAVESNFLAFANKKHIMFSVNEEKQMICGVIMRCDFPIYRIDEQLGEYYLVFGREVIEQMAEKMLKDNTQNNINMEHSIDIDGVEMLELFIKDTSKGINPMGFEDVTDGSLFATYKVNNPEIWQMIKDKTFLGFSLEGSFLMNKQKDEKDELDEILDLINKIENKRNKK